MRARYPYAVSLIGAADGVVMRGEPLVGAGWVGMRRRRMKAKGLAGKVESCGNRPLREHIDFVRRRDVGFSIRPMWRQTDACFQQVQNCGL